MARNSRRLVTVLFADLTNYTPAAQRADPEAIYLTIRRLLERLAQPVQQFGGYIDRYVGDGFLATFGIPVANEDDPVRALMAAVRMQQMMVPLGAEARDRLGWAVQLRIGVNAGTVISGQLDAGGLPDSSVFGHTVNLAQRLQSAARPGTILVSEALYRLARQQFAFLEPVKFQLKGIDEPVVGYEVAGPRRDPQSARGLSGRRTELVGRAGESESLLAGLQRLSLERRGIIALVTGDAGIGKSRMVEEIILPLSGTFRVVRASCSPYERRSYGLLADLLAELAGLRPQDGQEERIRQFEGWLAGLSSLPDDVAPILVELVKGPDSGAGWRSDPQQQQQSIYGALRRLLVWLSRRQPVILVMDDVQWADPSSLDVLGRITDLIQETSLALVAIARSPDQASLPPFLTASDSGNQPGLLQIKLDPLAVEDSDHLVDLLLSEAEVPAHLKQTIYDRTGGSPLLIEELIRMLLDEGAIAASGEGWQVAREWEEVVRAVPDTVNGLLLRRYDRLSEELRQVLDVAAVLGENIQLPLLASILEMPEGPLREWLRSLEAADFFRRSPGATVPTFFFRHALMQEAIYNTMLQEERRRWHLRAGEVMQQLGHELVFGTPALIGYHLEKGGARQAVGYLVEAAQQASRRYANEEAIAYYRRVQALLDLQGPSDLDVDVPLALGELLARVGRTEEAEGLLLAAREASRAAATPGYRLGDISYFLGLLYEDRGEYAAALEHLAAAATALQESAAQCRSFSQTDIERELGWVSLFQNRLAEAETHGHAALALAKGGTRQGAVASACNLLAAVAYWSGDWSASMQQARAALEIREQMGQVWAAASTQTTLGALYHRIGRWAEAEAMLRQAIFVQQEVGDHHNLGLSWTNLGMLLMESGRLDEAMQCMNQAVATLPRLNDPPAMKATLHFNRGIVRLRANLNGEAIADFEVALKCAKSVEKHDLCALCTIYLAESSLREGAKGDSPAVLLAMAESYNESIWSSEISAEAHRVKALLASQNGEWEMAVAANEESRKLYGQLGYGHEVARSKLDAAEIQLARYEAGGGLDPSVQEGVLEALETFRQLSAQLEIKRAEDLLVRISAILMPADAASVRLRQRPMVVISLQLTLPAHDESDSARHETIAQAADQLAATLHQIGQNYSAVDHTTPSGLTYILSSSDQAGLEQLVLRAIECAQSAVDAAVRFNRTWQKRSGLAISLRAGIAGAIYRRPLAERSHDSLFAGLAPIGQQAEQAATLAASYQIVLAYDAAQLVRSSFLLEPVDAGGQDSPAGPYHILGLARTEGELFRLMPGSSPRLIGRQEELSQLGTWIEQNSQEPAGRVCYMEAEAGMGKSRLLQELLALARPSLHCLVAKFEPFRTGTSYWILHTLLDDPSLPVTPAAHRLQALLGVRPPDDADEALLRTAQPASLRQELFGRVREYLLSLAESRHVLLVVEDIHWMDLSSLDLVDFLLPLTLEAPVSLMLVARAEMPGPHRALISKAKRVCRERYLELSFDGLTEEDGRALMATLLQSEALPDGLWEWMRPFARHPLSVEEGLRFLVERRWLWRTAGVWQVDSYGSQRQRAMPASLTDLILARLDHLDSETQHVLQAAAVLGESVDRSVLKRVLPGPTVGQRLAELVQRGWLLPAPTGSPLQYQFRHSLTRETIYATLLRSKLQLLHQRAGEAIETLYPEAVEENVELLAHHFTASGVQQKAIQYLVRAAEKSASRDALAESLRFYRHAEELLKQGEHRQPALMARVLLGLASVHLSQGDPGRVVQDILPLLARTYFEPSADIQAAGLRRLGDARHKMGELAAALENYEAALSRLENWRASHSGDAMPVLANSRQELFSIKKGKAQVYFDMRRNEEAREQARQLLSVVDQRQYPVIAAELYNLLGGIAYREGELQTAEKLVQQGLAIYQNSANRSGAASAYANLGVLAAARQDFDAAHDYLRFGLAIHQALGNAFGVVVTENNLGQMERDRGRFKAALAHFEAAVAGARPAELTQLLAQTLSNLGTVHTLLDQPDEALPVLEEAETLASRYTFRDLLCEVLWKQADCLQFLGKLAAAAEFAQEALSLAQELQSHDLRCEALRILGRVYRAQKMPEKAVRASAEAWQLQAEQPRLEVRRRFAADYALCLASAGREQEAQRLASEFDGFAGLRESPTFLGELRALAGAPVHSLAG